MTNNQKFISGLLVGAAAGAALTIFFSSEKGKEILADAKNKLQELNFEFDTLLAKGKIFVDEMEAKISEG